MKQVKYRLWCNNKKEWEKDEWHLTSDGIIIDTKRNIEMKKETHFLNQFTGLFDKQGVEIYEGDIIKLFEHKGIIQYECGSFGIVFTDCIDLEEIEENIYPVTGCDNDLHACKNDNFISLWEIYWNFNDEDDYLNTVEMIGNIYENPDLLEVQHED